MTEQRHGRAEDIPPSEAPRNRPEPAPVLTVVNDGPGPIVSSYVKETEG